MGVFTERYIRPLFCEGVGPFRWLAISGDPQDIYAVDDIILEHFAGEPITHWITAAREAVQFTGLPARIGWLGYGDRRKLGLLVNDAVASGRISGPIAFTRDHLDSGSVAAPGARDRAHARRLRRHRRLADPERAAQHRLARRPRGRARLRRAGPVGRRDDDRRRHRSRPPRGSAPCSRTIRESASCVTRTPATRPPSQTAATRRIGVLSMAIAREDALGLDEVAEALDNGWTLPARWYSDPDVAELEHQRIFARSWTLLCPEAKLASPGDHVVGSSGRVPVRRHARRRGQAPRLRQRLPAPRPPGGDEGRLPQAPAVPLPRLDVHARRQAAERAAHVARDGLRPRGLLARARSPSTPGAASCSSIPTPPRRRCTTSTRRSSRSRSSATSASPTGSSATHWVYPIEANWKVFVENATECYHCPTVHTKSFSDAFITDANVYELVETGGLLCQFTPYNARRANTRWGGQTGDGFRFIYLWPTSFWAQDDQVAFTGMIVPTGVESCEFHADVYSHPQADETFVADWMEMYDKTFEEDADVVRVQQAGLKSQMIPYGRLLPEEREPDPALPPARATTRSRPMSRASG